MKTTALTPWKGWYIYSQAALPEGYGCPKLFTFFPDALSSELTLGSSPVGSFPDLGPSL